MSGISRSACIIFRAAVVPIRLETWKRWCDVEQCILVLFTTKEFHKMAVKKFKVGFFISIYKN